MENRLSVGVRHVSPPGEVGGGRSALMHYISPILVGVIVKALEGREERQATGPVT